MGGRQPGRVVLREEDGYFLVLALAVTTILLVVASALAMVGTAALRAARVQLDRARALYAAESGLHHALQLLIGQGTGISQLASDDPAHQPWSELAQEQQYRFWVDTANPVCASYRLLADGQSGSRLRRVRVLVSGEILFTGALVDLSQPECAGYDPPEVSVPSPSTWPCPGPGCEVRVPGNDETFTGPGAYYVDGSWTVARNGSMTFTGSIPPGQALNLVINGNLTLMQDTLVSFAASGPVNVYVNGNLDIKQNSRMSSSPDSQVRIYLWGNLRVWQDAAWEFAVQDWVIFRIRGGLEFMQDSSVRKAPGYTQRAVVFLLSTSGSGDVSLYQDFDLQAGIYAPTRTVVLRTNDNPQPEQLYGAIVGSGVQCQGAGGCGSLTYDEALRDFVLGGWSIVEGSWREERIP